MELRFTCEEAFDWTEIGCGMQTGLRGAATVRRRGPTEPCAWLNHERRATKLISGAPLLVPWNADV